MFDFFKKKKNGRLSGTYVTEEFNTRPIPFRTYYGGSRPTEYVETDKMKSLYAEALGAVESAISQRLIDEYTDPRIFDSIIEAYFKQIENEIERQHISFSDVIQSIRNVAKEALYRGKRDEETLNAVIKEADENKKGKGDSYVEIEK